MGKRAGGPGSETDRATKLARKSPWAQKVLEGLKLLGSESIY